MESLNGRFHDVAHYFNQVVELLEKYQWLFKSPNTHVLVHDILANIPVEWIPILRLSQKEDVRLAIAGQPHPNWPGDLREFVTGCWNLSLKSECIQSDTASSSNSSAADDPKKWKKTNPKKVHEVVNFSRLIGQECKKNNTTHVVDIGAGLGYLDKELSESCDLHVLGLERDAYRVAEANQRVFQASGDPSPGSCRATFKELSVSGLDFYSQVESVVQVWLSDCPAFSPLCLIGLHSCGDLSPVMMKLFVSNPRFSSLLLVSCCYHRMQLGDPSQERYFPLSENLKTVLCRRYEGNTSQPFHQQESLQYLFRLAAQETTNRWLHDSASCDRQSRNTFHRALLEYYAEKEGLQLAKKHRRAVKKEQGSSSFEDYVIQAIEGFGLEGDASVHRSKLMEAYQMQAHWEPAVETFTILQAVLQPVAEAFLLIDRLVYLRENGVASAILKQIFDDHISPRCFVTLAHKN